MSDTIKQIADQLKSRFVISDYTNRLAELEAEVVKWCVERREEIMLAFVAEYGCKPSECEMVQELCRWCVRKKSTADTPGVVAVPVDRPWISVRDRLPDEGQWVLALAWPGRWYEVGRQYDGVWKCGERRNMPFAPTYWMPLPDPPKEDE